MSRKDADDLINQLVTGDGLVGELSKSIESEHNQPGPDGHRPGQRGDLCKLCRSWLSGDMSRRRAEQIKYSAAPAPDEASKLAGCECPLEGYHQKTDSYVYTYCERCTRIRKALAAAAMRGRP